MSNDADCSDAIARVQVWRSALMFLEPDGKWSESPLLAGWQQNRYALSPAALATLEEQLSGEFRAASTRYLQRKTAGHRKDSNRIQLELPGVRYGA